MFGIVTQLSGRGESLLHCAHPGPELSTRDPEPIELHKASAQSISVAVCILAACLCSCRYIPTRGGSAAVKPSSQPALASEVHLKQGDNAATGSEQEIDRTIDQTREYEPILTAPTAVSSTNSSVAYSTPTKYTTHTTERIRTKLGAAQHDSSREISAGIRSMRPVQFAGIALVLAALAMFWAPVRAVTQSSTLQIFTGAVGLVLIFLPLVISTSPGWFAAATIAGIALPTAYFFIHRHGQMRGFIDANRNGIDDRKESRDTSAS